MASLPLEKGVNTLSRVIARRIQWANAASQRGAWLREEGCWRSAKVNFPRTGKDVSTANVTPFSDVNLGTTRTEQECQLVSRCNKLRCADVGFTRSARLRVPAARAAR